jgi:hypothetical protein
VGLFTSSLRKVQILGGGAEEVLGGSLHTVCGAVEEHDVQIALKDLVLGVLLLQCDGEFHLPEFVADVLLAAEDHLIRPVLGQPCLVDHVGDVLLGDGGCALLVALGEVGHDGPKNPLRIKARVFVEPAVLDGNDGVLDVGRHLVQRDPDAVLRIEGGDELAVGREHFSGLRRRLDREFLGQAVEEADRGTDSQSGRCYSRYHQARGQNTTRNTRRQESQESSQGRTATTPALLLRHFQPPSLRVPQDYVAFDGRSRGREVMIW